jgi:hypothetical protein
MQLLLYAFDEHARFEGRLVGALERLESGGQLRIVEALFLSRDADTEELVAVDLHSRGQGSMVAPLLDFRLDPGKRRRVTQKTMASEAEGGALRELGAALAPGTALAAVLVEHAWAAALEDAVAETGGSPVASEFVGAGSLSELAPAMLAAADAAPAPRDDAA